MRWLWALTVALVLGLGAAQAETRKALVLAAEDYVSLRPLANPVGDALALDEMLQGIGFDVVVETDRNLKRMRRALEDFAEDAAGADVALVYFGGHGVEIGGVNYLLPVDARADTAAAIAETGLPLAEVQAVLAQVAPVGIVLLDACRENPFGGGSGAGRSAAPLEDAAGSAPRPGLGRVGRADGVLFAFSAAPGEVASDGQGDHSPFADALLRHFATPGVEVRTALTLVQQDVYDRSRGRQLPYVESGLPKLFFASTSGAMDERGRLLIGMADLPAALRAKVERVAAENDMPLAPLYGTVLAGGLADQPEADQRAALVEAARVFLQIRDDMQRLAAVDPEVTRLRSEAEAALDLGETERAQGLLAQAVALDGTARDALAENYRARTLSQASSLAMAVRTARLRLDYRGALELLAQALPLYAEIDGPDLATADRLAYSNLLWDRGELQLFVGRSDLALKAYQDWQAVEAARLLREPGARDWRRYHNVAARNAGLILMMRGQRAAAEALFLATEADAAQLAAEPGAGLKIRHDLFALQLDLADLAEASGRLAEARAKTAAALATIAGLAAEFPDRADVQRDLAGTHDRAGDRALQAVDLAEAAAQYRAADALRRGLLAASPQDMALRREAAGSLGKLSLIEKGQGHWQAATDLLLREIAERQVLVAAAPDDLALKADSFTPLLYLGDVQRDAGNPAAAVPHYEAALVLMREMVALDPGNADWLDDLLMVIERRGTVAMKLGDMAGAEAAFTEGLAQVRQALAADPQSPRWRATLAVMLDRLGDIAFQRMDFPAAAAAYGESFAITRAFAEAEPDNAGRQLDLVTGLIRQVSVVDDPLAPLTEARDILARLQAAGQLDAAHAGWPDMVQQMIDTLKPQP